MLSIQKILVLVAILWIVWTIFKFFDRRNSNLKDNKKNIKVYGKKNRTELPQLLRHMDINISFSKRIRFK